MNIDRVKRSVNLLDIYYYLLHDSAKMSNIYLLLDLSLSDIQLTFMVFFGPVLYDTNHLLQENNL